MFLFLFLFLFSLHVETEIVLGLPSQLSEGANADRGGAEREMKEIWSKMQKSFRRLFFEDVSPEEHSSWKYDKASAWYAVAYGIKTDLKHEVHTTTPRGGRFLGFGWIMGDILCEIPKRQVALISPDGDLYDATTTEKSTFLLYFGHHLTSHWMAQSKELFEIMKIKMIAFKNLDEAIGPGSATLFGSVAQYLCDAFSDIDICVPVPVPVQESKSVSESASLEDMNKNAVRAVRTLCFSDDVLEGIPSMSGLPFTSDEEEPAGNGKGKGEVAGVDNTEARGDSQTGIAVKEEEEVNEKEIKEDEKKDIGDMVGWMDMPIDDLTLPPFSPPRSPDPVQTPLESPFCTTALSPPFSPTSSPFNISPDTPLLSPPSMPAFQDRNLDRDRVNRECCHLNSTVAPLVTALTIANKLAVPLTEVPVLRYVRSLTLCFYSRRYKLLTRT